VSPVSRTGIAYRLRSSTQATSSTLPRAGMSTSPAPIGAATVSWPPSTSSIRDAYIRSSSTTMWMRSSTDGI